MGPALQGWARRRFFISKRFITHTFVAAVLAHFLRKRLRNRIAFADHVQLGKDRKSASYTSRHSGASAERLDCMLDATSGRRGHFWMFVRDKEEHRAYIQLTRDYLLS